MTDMTTSKPRLYLITPPEIDTVSGFVAKAEQAFAGGDVAALQIRIKDADEVIDRSVSRALALALKPICAAANVALIMNDAPDLCAELDLDGVHVGASDTPVAQAREIVGLDRIVGATCKNSRDKAMRAAEAGADYVAFGAFYPTPTKQNATPADIETLEAWAEFATVPVVAIGGVTADNAAPLIAAGADFIAVVRAVWDHPQGPKAGVAAFGL